MNFQTRTSRSPHAAARSENDLEGFVHGERQREGSHEDARMSTKRRIKRQRETYAQPAGVRSKGDITHTRLDRHSKDTQPLSACSTHKDTHPYESREGRSHVTHNMHKHKASRDLDGDDTWMDTAPSDDSSLWHPTAIIGRESLEGQAVDETGQER